MSNEPKSQLDEGEESRREQLLDQLLDCLERHSGDRDLSDIDRCLEELERAGAEAGSMDVEQGLEQFHRRFEAAFESRVKEKKPAGKRRILTRLMVVAALVGTFSLVAQGSNWKIFSAVASWTGEQFSVLTPGEKRGIVPDGKEYTSLQEVLEDYDVTEPLLPTWFPEGMQVADVMVKGGQEYLCFSAVYTCGEERMVLSLREVGTVPASVVEIDDSGVEVYVSGNAEHYIMRDVKQIKATWYRGSWECSISGGVDKGDLLKMIDSIYR